MEVLRATARTPNAATAPAIASAARRLTARAATDGAASFSVWAAEAHGLTPDAVLAGLAGASLDGDTTVNVAVERVGGARVYAIPPGRALSAVAPTEEAPHLLLRDLRGTRLASVEMGPEDVPVLTVIEAGGGVQITLECAVGNMDGGAAIRLLSDFAGRMEQPLRHLL